jgi:hypothetical protein
VKWGKRRGDMGSNRGDWVYPQSILHIIVQECRNTTNKKHQVLDSGSTFGTYIVQ